MSEGIATRPRLARPPAQDASVVAADDAPLPPPEAPPAGPQDEPPPLAAVDPDHFDMEHAPKDGRRLVLVSEDGVRQVGCWRVSRRFTAKAGRWEHQEFWSDPLNAHAPIQFDPIGWMEDDWQAPV